MRLQIRPSTRASTTKTSLPNLDVLLLKQCNQLASHPATQTARRLREARLFPASFPLDLLRAFFLREPVRDCCLVGFMSDGGSNELGDGYACLERRVCEEGQVYIQDIDLFSVLAQVKLK